MRRSVFILIIALLIVPLLPVPAIALADNEGDTETLIFDKYFDGSENGSVLGTFGDGAIYKIQCTDVPVNAFVNAPGRTEIINCGQLSPPQLVYNVDQFYLTMDNVTAGRAHVKIWQVTLATGCTSLTIDYGQSSSIRVLQNQSVLLTSVEGHIVLDAYNIIIPRRYTPQSAQVLTSSTAGGSIFTFSNNTSFSSPRADVLVICAIQNTPNVVTPTATRTNTPLPTNTRTSTPIPTNTRTSTPIPPTSTNNPTNTRTSTPIPTNTPRPPTATTIPPTATPVPPSGCANFSGASNGQGIALNIQAGYTGYMLLSKAYQWVDLEYLSSSGQWVDATPFVQVNQPAALPTNLGPLRFWSYDSFTVRLCAGSIPPAPTATTFPVPPTATTRPATAIPQPTATIKPVNTVNVPTPVPADNVQCTDMNVYGGVESTPTYILPETGSFGPADYVQIMYRTRDYMTLQVRTTKSGAIKGDYAVNQGFQPYDSWGASLVYVRLAGSDAASSSAYMTLRICHFVEVVVPTSTPTSTPTPTPNLTATAQQHERETAAVRATADMQTAIVQQPTLHAQATADHATLTAIAAVQTATIVAGGHLDCYIWTGHNFNLGGYTWNWQADEYYTQNEVDTGNMIGFYYEPIGQFSDNSAVKVMDNYGANGAPPLHDWDGVPVVGDAHGFGGFLSNEPFSVRVCGVWDASVPRPTTYAQGQTQIAGTATSIAATYVSYNTTIPQTAVAGNATAAARATGTAIAANPPTPTDTTTATATPTDTGDDLPGEPTATAGPPTATAGPGAPTATNAPAATPIYNVGQNAWLPPCVGVLPTPDPDIATPDISFALPTWQPFAEPERRDPIDTGDTLKNVRLMATDGAAPVQTLVAWSSVYIDGGGWAAGTTAAAPISEKVSDTFGWLYIFKMLGPLNFILLPVFLMLLIKIIRATLSVVKYIKQILPFQ